MPPILLQLWPWVYPLYYHHHHHPPLCSTPIMSGYICLQLSCEICEPPSALPWLGQVEVLGNYVQPSSSPKETLPSLMADLCYLCPPPSLPGLGLNLARQNEGKGLGRSIFRTTWFTVIGVFKKFKVSCHRPTICVHSADSPLHATSWGNYVLC